MKIHADVASCNESEPMIVPRQDKSMIQSLTSFRFITAFVVFIFHCRVHLKWQTDIDFVNRFISHGAIFMSGFFVLSGFIMSHVYHATDFTKASNIWRFYIKRFAKIYPVYALSTIAYFAFFRDYTHAEHARIAINDLFLIQGFFPSMFRLGLNGGTWSLTVEMFLYILFPFLMLLGGKSFKIAIIGVALAVLVSINVSLFKDDPVYANPVFRLADFMCGIGAYFGCAYINRKRYFHPLSVCLLILVSVYLGSSKFQYMRGQFMVVPLFAVWIAAVYGSRSRIYNNKVLEYLGLISYSFYLWQFAAIQFGKKLIVWLPDTNLNLIVLIVFVVNVGVSSLSYHLVENRARLWILAKFARKIPVPG